MLASKSPFSMSLMNVGMSMPTGHPRTHCGLAQSRQRLASTLAAPAAGSTAIARGEVPRRVSIPGCASSIANRRRAPSSPSRAGKGVGWTGGASPSKPTSAGRATAADDQITNYLLDQMSMTGGEDTFGIGAVGVPAKWKGGWGPGTDGKYLVRQMGVMTVDGKDMVVSLAAIADNGTFESAQAMATEMATWASQNLSDEILKSVPCGPVAEPTS